MWGHRNISSQAVGDYVLNCHRVDVWIDDTDAEFSLREVTPVEKLTDEQISKTGSSYCWGVKPDGRYVLLYPNLREIREAVRLAFLNE